MRSIWKPGEQVVFAIGMLLAFGHIWRIASGEFFTDLSAVWAEGSIAQGVGYIVGCLLSIGLTVGLCIWGAPPLSDVPALKDLIRRTARLHQRPPDREDRANLGHIQGPGRSQVMGSINAPVQAIRRLARRVPGEHRTAAVAVGVAAALASVYSLWRPSGLPLVILTGLAFVAVGAVASRKALLLGLLASLALTLLYVPWQVQDGSYQVLMGYAFLWSPPNRVAHPEPYRIAIEWGLLAIGAGFAYVLKYNGQHRAVSRPSVAVLVDRAENLES